MLLKSKIVLFDSFMYRDGLLRCVASDLRKLKPAQQEDWGKLIRMVTSWKIASISQYCPQLILSGERIWWSRHCNTGSWGVWLKWINTVQSSCHPLCLLYSMRWSCGLEAIPSVACQHDQLEWGGVVGPWRAAVSCPPGPVVYLSVRISHEAQL